MRHLWNISYGSFIPRMSSAEKHGQVIITEKRNPEMIGEIITDHVSRSTVIRDAATDYRVEDFGDEIHIFVKTGPARLNRWRRLLNLQYEGAYA